MAGLASFLVAASTFVAGSRIFQPWVSHVMPGAAVIAAGLGLAVLASVLAFRLMRWIDRALERAVWR